MSRRPLAEVYERLKELRRRGGLPGGLSERPTEPYDETEVARQPIAAGEELDWQASVTEMIKALEVDDSADPHKELITALGLIETSARVLRNLDISVTAD